MCISKNRGITLISLIITTILLLILAGVSLQAFTGSGLFENAKLAREQTELAQLEEQMKLKITEMITEKDGGKITVEEYIKDLTKKDKINITDRYEEEGKQIIVVDDEYVFEITEDEQHIDINKVGIKEKLPPKITLSSIKNTTNSITVKVDTKRNEGGKIEYYIKGPEDGDYTLKESQNDEKREYTYTGLEQNKKYSIKIVSIAKNKQTAEILVDRTLGSVPNLDKGDIEFTYIVDGKEIDEKTWTNKEVTVKVNVKKDITGYTIRTSRDGKAWDDATSQDFKENGIIYVVLYDGKNYGSSASENITNIDKTNPSNPIISFVSGTVGENGYYQSDVQLKITQGQDEDSGIQKVTYTLTGAMTLEETEIANEGTVKITAEGTTTITAYSYDKANNKSEGATYIIKKDSVAPTITLTQTNTSSREYSKTVIASVTDDTSQVQIKKYAYKNQEASYFESNGNDLENSFTVTTENVPVGCNDEPQFIYTVYAKDNAGNTKVQTITLTNLLVDNTVTGNNGLTYGDGATKNDSTGVITLPTGRSASQYGPYWNLPGGNYEITYTGNNLPTTLDGLYYSYGDYGSGEHFSLSLQSATSSEVIYRVTIPDNVVKAEFVLYNWTSNIITINNVRIKQL